MILGCMHALLLAEATTQLVDIHGHTEYILNSQLTRTYHGAPAVPASAQSSAFDGEAAEPSPTSLPTEILRAAATGELLALKRIGTLQNNSYSTNLTFAAPLEHGATKLALWLVADAVRGLDKRQDIPVLVVPARNGGEGGE